MIDNFLKETDFKLIKHPSDVELNDIKFVDYQIYKKSEERIIADIVYVKRAVEKNNCKFDIDNFVSEYYILINASCTIKSESKQVFSNFAVDVNSLNLKALTKFCVEAKNLNIVNYISNKDFFFEKENQNLVEISSDYDINSVSQNTVRSIFTKIAAKQLLERLKKQTDFVCKEDNSLQIACETLPKATDFNFDSETKHHTFEKSYYENDKNLKTTYTLYSKDNHIVYEANNYILNTDYNFVDGIRIDTKDNEVVFKTTKMIDNEKIVIERDYENRKLIFTHIGGENSRFLK